MPRAVVFENGGKKLVMITSDLGSYTDTLYTVIKKSIMEKFGLKDSEFFLAAIHSHSSPVVSLDIKKMNENNVKYTQALQQKLLAVVGDAFRNLKPVNTGAGVGYSPVGSNRREMTSDGSITLGRNPYGPTDKEVLVLKMTDTMANLSELFLIMPLMPLHWGRIIIRSVAMCWAFQNSSLNRSLAKMSFRLFLQALQVI